MGFCYGRNPFTNRMQLACDFCSKIGEVRKIKCPFGYCQAYATCKACKPLNNKELHLRNKCDVYAKEYEENQLEKKRILEQGSFLRVSALGHGKNEGTPEYVCEIVKVIFRNKDGLEKAFFMKPETYNKVPLGNNATIEDYQKIEPLKETNNLNIYEAI